VSLSSKDSAKFVFTIGLHGQSVKGVCLGGQRGLIRCVGACGGERGKQQTQISA
jgi:hypothetical protein